MSKAVQTLVKHISEWCEDHGVPISQVSVTGDAALVLHGVGIGVDRIRICLPQDILDNLIVETRETLVEGVEVFTFKDSWVEVFTEDLRPVVQGFEVLNLATLDWLNEHIAKLALPGHSHRLAIINAMINFTDDEEMELIDDVLIPRRVFDKLHGVDASKLPADFPLKYEYHVSLWGGAFNDDWIFQQLPQMDGKSKFWFDTKKERDDFMALIDATADEAGQTVARSFAEGHFTRLRTMSRMKYTHGGKEYRLIFDFGFGYGADSARYMFEDGNYACAGNISTFLSHHYPEIAPHQNCDCHGEPVFDMVDYEHVMASEFITIEQQVNLWKQGISVHKLPDGLPTEGSYSALPGTCVPDFSCCDGTLLLPQAKRVTA